MTVSVPPRNAWLEWLKNIAGAVVVTGALGASAVIAASESQQPMPGNAIVVLCGAVGRVPPLAGLSHTIPEAHGLHLAVDAEPSPGPTVLVNSFASGGALFSLVLRVGGLPTLV